MKAYKSGLRAFFNDNVADWIEWCFAPDAAYKRFRDYVHNNYIPEYLCTTHKLVRRFCSATKEPCTQCQYFPIYPVRTTPPLVDCVSVYDDDFLYGSAPHMNTALIANGHDSRFLTFTKSGNAVGYSGHVDPLNNYD